MRKKILICDDDEIIRESLKLALSELYELVAVDSGEQALHALANAPEIGVALVDIKMPELNGRNLLPQIKTKHPQLKIIAVTGYKSSETAQRGADGYIGKPLRSQEILETVKRILK